MIVYENLKSTIEINKKNYQNIELNTICPSSEMIKLLFLNSKTSKQDVVKDAKFTLSIELKVDKYETNKKLCGQINKEYIIQNLGLPKDVYERIDNIEVKIPSYYTYVNMDGESGVAEFVNKEAMTCTYKNKTIKVKEYEYHLIDETIQIELS